MDATEPGRVVQNAALDHIVGARERRDAMQNDCAFQLPSVAVIESTALMRRFETFSGYL